MRENKKPRFLQDPAKLNEVESSFGVIRAREEARGSTGFIVPHIYKLTLIAILLSGRKSRLS